MNSDVIWGVDLGGSPWPCVRRQIAAGGAGFRDEPGEAPGPDLLRDSESLLDAAALGEPVPPDLAGWLKRVRAPIRPHLPERSLIGVAYPRTMPPILREVLPTLFGCEPAASKSGLPADSPLVGIDAPTALVLEALALKAIPNFGTFAVASGVGASREWTAVTIEKNPSRTPAIQGLVLRIHLGETRASPDAIGLDPGATRLVAGPPSTPDDLDAPTIRLAPSAVAEGAARFALWLAIDRLRTFPAGSAAEGAARHALSIHRRMQAVLLPGSPVVTTETIHPLGLVGHNGRGSWFWRRLFEPGTAIPSPRVPLRSSTPPPSDFYFAECLDPGSRTTLWLTQDQWPRARLRWHSAYFHSDTHSPAPPRSWWVEMRDFNDDRRDASAPREEVPPRWGLPTWITRVEPAAPVSHVASPLPEVASPEP